LIEICLFSQIGFLQILSQNTHFLVNALRIIMQYSSPHNSHFDKSNFVVNLILISSSRSKSAIAEGVDSKRSSSFKKKKKVSSKKNYLF
jgi:hypothetical protein